MGIKVDLVFTMNDFRIYLSLAIHFDLLYTINRIRIILSCSVCVRITQILIL